MNLQEYVDRSHGTARAKGWWTVLENGDVKSKPPMEMKMLMVTEVAEATEEVRAGKPPVYANITRTDLAVSLQATVTTELKIISDAKLKPEGEAVELADCVIRIMDYFGACKWNLDLHMKDSFHIDPRESAIGTHMEIVRMIAAADGVDSEKMLGRVVKVIREYFQSRQWDFEAIVKLKMDYNDGRSFRHGGKLA